MRSDASQPPVRKTEDGKVTKNSPTKEKGIPNKVAHKESSQEVQKTAAKKFNREPRIDRFVTSQSEKAKRLAATDPGKDDVRHKEEKGEQHASPSRERMQGFHKEQVQDAIKTLGKYAHQSVSEK